MPDEPPTDYGPTAPLGQQLSQAEAVLAEVWKEVLEIDHVGPDDDFFSCGGDSLLAINVISAAQQRGLAVTLLNMFKHPTIRGMCGTLTVVGGAAPTDTTDLLSPADRTRVPPGVRHAMPATRLQLGLIYESLMSDGSSYVCTSAYDINRALCEPVLREAIHLLTARHDMLCTRFDLSDFSEAVQLVGPSVEIPLIVADHQALEDAELTRRTELVMKELRRPFDPETAPLVRLHAAMTGPKSFRLAYSYHHALFDGWSSAIFINELVVAYVALLSGQSPTFAAPVPFAEFVRLEREAEQSEASRSYFESLRGIIPAADTFRVASQMINVEAVVPQGDTDRLFARAAQWRVPPKSLLLAAHCAAIAAERGETRPAVALLTSGRPEVQGGDLTLGLFINYLPVCLDLTGATWEAAAHRAFDAERELLPHRRFPHSEVLKIVGSRPFEASFNYVHLRPRIQMIEADLIGPGYYSDLTINIPIGVDVANTGTGLAVNVAINISQYGGGFGNRLMSRFLDGIHRLAEDPGESVIPA